MMIPIKILSIAIEISPELPLTAKALRNLEIYIGRYVAQLCRNLGLPSEVSLTVTSADLAIDLPSQFRLRINDNACRCRLWPYVPLSDLPLRELATVLSEAIHHSREWLLTPAHAEFLAGLWKVQLGENYPHGWTAEIFHRYLRAFVRRNFSVSRARSSVASVARGITSERDVELLVEECLESSEQLHVGIALRVGSAQLMEGLDDILTHLSRAIVIDSGVALPTITATLDDDLDENDFCIQINDTLLPPCRAVPARCKIAIATKNVLVGAGISSQLIVEPLVGMISQLIDSSDETSAKARGADIVLLEQPSAAYIGWSVAAAVRRNGGSLLAAPIVQFLLDRVRRDSPDLVSQAQSLLNTLSDPPGRVGVLRWSVTAILRHLLDEQVSIRDFHAVLESVLYLRVLRTSDGKSRVVSFRTPVSVFHVTDRPALSQLSIAELSQGARFCLRSLMLRYARAADQATSFLPLIFSDPIRQRLLEAGTRPLVTQESRALRYAVMDQVRRFGIDDTMSILVDQGLRMRTRELLCVEFPTLGIIGVDELARTLGNMAPAGVIDWPSAPDTQPSSA